MSAQLACSLALCTRFNPLTWLHLIGKSEILWGSEKARREADHLPYFLLFCGLSAARELCGLPRLWRILLHSLSANATGLTAVLLRSRNIVPSYIRYAASTYYVLERLTLMKRSALIRRIFQRSGLSRPRGYQPPAVAGTSSPIQVVHFVSRAPSTGHKIPLGLEVSNL